jgi:hypothetical protein
MPTESPEAFGPRKRKLSTKVTTNGDPEVERKRKKLEAKKKSMKPAPTQKHSLKKTAAQHAPRQRHPSVEIEEIEDESDLHTSVPPRNPRHILEAANSSDNDVDTTVTTRKSTSTKKRVITIEETEDKSDFYLTSVPSRNPQHIPEAADGSDEDDDKPEKSNAPEETEEAELGM